MGGAFAFAGAAGSTPVPSPLQPLAVQFYRSYGPEWVINAGESIVVLVLAYVLGRFVVQIFGRRISRRFRRPSLTRTVIRAIRVSIFLFAILTVLGIYGLELSDIALSVTVFSAVVGVILAPIVGSIISGVFLIADQPYEIGDMIRMDDTDQTGFVEDITLRYTKIFTLDNTFLVIPNGAMRDRDVINFSAEDPRTRLELPILITYESDLPRARSLTEQAARDVDVVIEGGPDIRIGAARYPASPTCYIDEFGDHGIALTLRYWVEEPYKLLTTRSKVQTNVWAAFADEDVEIAYPHSHLFVDETTGTLDLSLVDGEAPAPDAAVPPEGVDGSEVAVPGGADARGPDSAGASGRGDADATRVDRPADSPDQRDAPDDGVDHDDPEDGGGPDAG